MSAEQKWRPKHVDRQKILTETKIVRNRSADKMKTKKTKNGSQARAQDIVWGFACNLQDSWNQNPINRHTHPQHKLITQCAVSIAPCRATLRPLVNRPVQLGCRSAYTFSASSSMAKYSIFMSSAWARAPRKERKSKRNKNKPNKNDNNDDWKKGQPQLTTCHERHVMNDMNDMSWTTCHVWPMIHNMVASACGTYHT